MKAEPQPGEVYFVDLGMADKPSFQRRPMALRCKPIEPGFKVKFAGGRLLFSEKADF